jgi:hypothetical protein
VREPVFTETTQIGIVVRDLDAANGIDPWDVFEFSGTPGGVLKPDATYP